MSEAARRMGRLSRTPNLARGDVRATCGAGREVWGWKGDGSFCGMRRWEDMGWWLEPLGAEKSLVEITMDPSRTDCWVQHASLEAISCSASVCGNLVFDVWSHAGWYGWSWDAVHLC